MTTGKTIALTIQPFVSKVMSLSFNRLSRFVIAFLPRSKHLLISWQQSTSSVILEPKKIKCHCFQVFLFYFPRSDGTGCHVLGSFECWVSSRYFHFPFLPSSRSSLLSAITPFIFCHLLNHLHNWGCWYFSRQSWTQLVIHTTWHFAWCTLHVS